MTSNELKQFIKNNSKLIGDKVNAYTLENNIKLSEFNDEQRKRLIVELAARQLVKMGI